MIGGDVLRRHATGPGSRAPPRSRSAPAAVSDGRSESSSHRCSSAGSRSLASEISAANPSVSAMTARACELARIHSACSAEEVS